MIHRKTWNETMKFCYIMSKCIPLSFSELKLNNQYPCQMKLVSKEHNQECKSRSRYAMFDLVLLLIFSIRINCALSI